MVDKCCQAVFKAAKKPEALARFRKNPGLFPGRSGQIIDLFFNPIKQIYDFLYALWSAVSKTQT